jgi:serine/threonine protein kinase
VSLPPGTRLGGYEIHALIGAGGMGEVYRARDTRLHRDVALKILPPELAGTPAAFERFEREAQAVAALSHPNILAVHDMGRTETASYVVFELLQGATVRERLAAGALPVRRAIDYARQVADGLAAAHERGIAHRDIKPDNLFVTDDGRVKILDFGLAHAVAVPGTDQARTLAPLTDAGMVLGTVGYMAPEQVRGQHVDARADLFALGCVLYEMCAGRRAFMGATPADTMTAVLTSDPPELLLPGQTTPPALDRIVRRCLEKRPTERFQSARDLSFALEALAWVPETPPEAPRPSPPARRGRSVPAAVLLALALTLGAVGGWLISRGRAVSPPAPPGPALRVEFPSTVRRTFASHRMALSPDGRRLAYSEDSRAILVRDLTTGDVDTLADTADAFVVCWSPRGDELLYFAGLELRRFRLADRSSVAIYSTADSFLGGVWLGDGTVVFALGRVGGLRRIPASGGVESVVVRAADALFRQPSALGPRTDYVLALRSTGGSATNREAVAVRLSDGLTTSILPSDAAPVFVPGFLLLARATGLYAVPFDDATLATTGEPVFAGEPVVWDGVTASTSLAASQNGVVAYRPGRDVALQFEWLDRTGASVGVIGAPAFYGSFALSPDGSRIVARRISNVGNQTSAGLMLIDHARGVSSPMAVPEGAISDPVWTVDGSRILYRLDSAFVGQAPASSSHDVLRREQIYPDAFSPDGRWLLVGRGRPDRGFGLYLMAADGSGDLQPIEEGDFNVDEASISPDGRLLSFQSTRSGRAEIYLATFPPGDDRLQVSPEGGVQARWSGDGRTLYFIDLLGRLMRVTVSASRPLQVGRAEQMFDLGIGAPSLQLEQYAVHGDRFLVLRPPATAAPQTIAVISNWQSLLPRAAASP